MHLMSSGYPQSNGKAEAAVKAMKKLIRRCTNNSGLDENLLAGLLLQYRNTPNRKYRLSPAQKLYGHRSIQDTFPVFLFIAELLTPSGNLSSMTLCPIKLNP